MYKESRDQYSLSFMRTSNFWDERECFLRVSAPNILKKLIFNIKEIAIVGITVGVHLLFFIRTNQTEA